MLYQMRDGMYQVRCRYPGCAFTTRLVLKEPILGESERELELKAENAARNLAQLKHDGLHGPWHVLRNPEVRRLAGAKTPVSTEAGSGERADIREYRAGEVILRRGEDAATVCEVVQGTAFPDRNPGHLYSAGDCFGAAALLANQSRTCNVVAGEGGARVAFHRLAELSRREPARAAGLYRAVMSDTLRVIQELERSLDRARDQVETAVLRG